MAETSRLTIANGAAVPLRSVPVLPFAAVSNEISSALGQGERIASLFGWRLDAGAVRLFVLLADDTGHRLTVLSTDVGSSYPSLTPQFPEAHMFEREIFEQLGVYPERHPWLKPVRGHSFEAGHHASSSNGNHRHEFFTTHAEETHEVGVGPVHAGVIEPGHFRFQCHGEKVHHLEIHLGYQHRGVEEAVIGGPHPRTMAQMEVVAGDTTIAHASAYCQAVEALAQVRVPGRALALRAAALELERLANHVGDIGALANDVGFLPTASFCGRIRGDFLNMTALLCGSRFGRGLVRPGGVAFDVDAKLIDTLQARLSQAESDLKGALRLFFETESVRSRMEGTGMLSTEACRELGIVGLVARASGLQRDCRADRPWGWYSDHPIAAVVENDGDVLARATVRCREIAASQTYVRGLLGSLPPGPCLAPSGRLGPNMMAASFVEGWRGEVVHVAVTDNNGCFARYKITDPSFHNWTGLALALRGGEISDFPLCNKSFNLSYCGFDL